VFVITAKPKKAAVREVVPPLIHWFRDCQVEVFVDKETAATLDGREKSLTRNEMPGQVDLIVVLGGDGTLLATARALNRKPVPLLAVNLGGLGFLTVITREELFATLELVLAGNLSTARRVQIEAAMVRADEVTDSYVAL